MNTLSTYIKDIRALHKDVIVKDMNFGERQLSSGIILRSDDAKNEGIRPRWGKVLCVGPDQKDIRPEQWILVSHGRWSRGIKINLNGEDLVVRRIDINDVLLVSDDEPTADDNLSMSVNSQ